MSLRGRGCLELKPSNNPFHQTTSADIGCVPNSKTEWTGNPDPAMKLAASRLGNTDHEVEHFSFLYTRESDKIGSKVKQPVIPRNRLLTKTEFLKKRREDLKAQELTDNDNMLLTLNGSPTKTVKKSAEEALLYYTQGTKVEDPRYTTSNVSLLLVLLYYYYYIYLNYKFCLIIYFN
jgi:hypothetical protein